MALRPISVLSLVLAAALFPSARAFAQSSETNKILYVVPHTHWEGAVFKTREGYLETGLQNILKALALLKACPEYKFTLDQVAYIKPFLERYPEEAGAFRKFLAEGRLQIAGGMDVMPDDVKPGGELFIRQIQYGKRYCREQLGVDVTTGWLLDTFGHHPQLPQIFALAGYKSFWFMRGVAKEETPSEFRWKGIDGTEIPAFWLPGGYGLLYGPPRDYIQFKHWFRERYDYLGGFTASPERVGLAGADVSDPEGYAPPLARRLNAEPDRAFSLRYAVPAEFEAIVAKRPNPPVIAADLDPIFQGTYSSRAELKQWTRDIERLLVTAEKLDVVSDWLSRPTDHAMLWRAWEPTLFNQTHDLASGVMTDVVYEDTTRSYAFSERLAREMIATAWDNISARIDTYGDGIPVVVYNSLGWARSDIAETEIGVASSGVKGFALLDADGKLAPVQILDSDRYGDGGIKRARIAFVARDVPALGHAVYRVIPSATAAAPEEAVAAPDENSMENETLRLAVDRATGEITSLFDKSGQWETLSGPANVVSRQLDKGDLWELYRGLDGGSHIAMTNQQAVPKPGQAIFSGEFKDKEGVIRRGPVFSEFSVSHPFASGSYSTRVRLYRGLRRVDVQTGLVNNEKWVRYQALFPTTIKNGSNVQEIPFGSVERPLGIEFPAQNWVDYGDGKRGVALLNRGMPGNLVSDGVLMLSLARSHNLGQYGYGGGYEPGMSSETGFELGKRLTFNYALVPHAADWRSAQVYRDGMEFNHPLIAQKAAVHPGKLPARWGLVEISATNVVLTSLNPGAGGTAVLRIYEAEGRAVAGVRVKLAARIRSAWEANLMEDSGRRLRVRGNTVEFDLHPFEIKTVKLALAPTP